MNEMTSSEIRYLLGGVLFGALWVLAMWGVVENMRSRKAIASTPDESPRQEQPRKNLYCAVCAQGKYHLFEAENDDFANRTAEGRYSWLLKVRRATEADKEWARKHDGYVPGEPPQEWWLKQREWERRRDAALAKPTD